MLCTLYEHTDILTCQCFSRCLIQACMPAGRPAIQHTSHRQPRPNVQRYVWTGPTAAYQHAARHLLLLLTKQWLITEHHLTQYQPQIIGDTVKPSLPARDIISEHASLEYEHEIYWLTQELNPGSSDRPSQSMHTVAQSPEPPRQVICDIIKQTIYTLHQTQEALNSNLQ